MSASAAQYTPLHAERRLGAPEWLILIGAAIFIFILWLSAYYDPSIRWLHFFQSWMYIAAIILSLRHSRWGYFIGISAGLFWDYANVFVTTFLKAGILEIARAIHTGDLAHPDLAIAVPAWTGNLLLVLGSLWAYSRLSKKSAGDALRFLIAFALCTAFLYVDIAVCQPRYLSLFPRLLHPHAPW